MIVYLDSSAVLRVLLRQPKPLGVWRRWERAYSSELLGVEARRVIDRLRLEGALDDAGVADAHQELASIEGAIGSIPLTRPVLRRAALPMATVVRTLDAIHLASALLLRERRGLAWCLLPTIRSRRGARGPWGSSAWASEVSRSPRSPHGLVQRSPRARAEVTPRAARRTSHWHILPERNADRMINGRAEPEKMMLDTPRIDSESLGDPLRHRKLEELEERFEALPRAPRERGRVELIVARSEGGRRESPDRVRLEADAGVPGDAWGRQHGPHAEKAITVMQLDVAGLIANGQPLALFGDNLFLSLDLSTDNLPPGSRVRAGGATLEVTPMPHNGCRKFRGRFGVDALRLVAKAELRHRNLRGIYMRTVEGGEIARGDPVEVIARASLTAADANTLS